jgi:hypothetical protein
MLFRPGKRRLLAEAAASCNRGLALAEPEREGLRSQGDQIVIVDPASFAIMATLPL